MDLLILDILGKDNPSVEGLDGDDCLQTEEIVVDLPQAQLPTPTFLADIPSPPVVRDKNRNTYQGADKSLARPGRKQATATKL